MTPEQWERAKGIVERAIQCAPAERAAFVATACAGDAELRQQIESLLGETASRGAPPNAWAPTPHASQPPAAEPVGTDDTRPGGIGTWGTLVLLNEVGRGAFGTVYRAWDPALAREVALKLIRIPPEDQDVAQTVLREGRLLARIRHVNVVTVYGAQQTGNEVGLWMEFVRGRTLAEIVDRDGFMAAEEAAILGISLCSALMAVHGAGLVHRDVKTRNVMREAGGRIVLMDFGTGRDLRQAAGTPGLDLAGTPLYMAPELLSGVGASPASDIYSLGVLLYHLVSGRYPVVGGTFVDMYDAFARGERQSLNEVRSDLPDWFVALVERATAIDPARRYRTAAQFRGELAAAVGRGATPQPDSWERVAETARERPPAPLPAVGGTDGAVLQAPDVLSEVAARVARQQRILRALLVALTLPVGLALLGFVNSMAFNVVFGRSGGFGWESPAALVIWGLRSLVAPVVYMAMAVVPVLLAVAAVRFLGRVSGRLRARFESIRTGVSSFAARLNLDDPGTLAQALLVAGAVALALIAGRFSGLMTGFFSPISEVPASALRVLDGANADEHILYGQLLDMFILALGAGSYYAFRLRRLRNTSDGGGSLLGCATLLGLAMLMWEIPYRVLWHNQFERAQFGGARCYIIGERGGEVLLHCPDASPPRNRVIGSSDEHLTRLGVIESVFTPTNGSGSLP